MQQQQLTTVVNLSQNFGWSSTREPDYPHQWRAAPLHDITIFLTKEILSEEITKVLFLGKAL